MKRFFQTAAAFVLVLLCLLPLASTDAAAIDSGKCGDNVIWIFDDGTLTLSGSGKMYDYAYDYGTSYDYTKAKAPWAKYTPEIKAVKADPAITHIGSMAFFCCSNLESVDLPGVLTVGEDAFYNCMRLVSVSLPAAEAIGNNAFANCTKLQTADFPKAGTIGEGVFSNCYDLHTVSLPKATALRKDVFKNCIDLTSVSFPAATAMERYAFLNCSSLTSLSLPALTAVPDYAFERLTALESANLPNVAALGKYAFNACESLRTVYLPKLILMQPHAFRACGSLLEANLPLLTAIPDYGFYHCSALQTVNAPLVTSIGDFAFQECSALQVADFPAVTAIGNCGFYLCTALTEAYFPALKTIDYNGFNNCRNLQLLCISTDLEQVNARAFEACRSLKSVYVGITKAEWEPSIDGYNNEYFLQAETVFDAPPFSLDPLPDSISAVKGSTVELDLNAHGSGCSFRWQMCLPNSDAWTDLSTAAHPTANSAKLFYGPVTDGDDGLKLRCVVTNRYGDTLTSEITVLTITPFADVAVTDYYFTPVLWAVDKGITSGISPVMFGSENPCTRGQVVTFLWRAAGSPEPAGSDMPFTDVPADAYYRTGVLWAIEQGITSGISADSFGPDVTCTRAQIMTMLWRAAGSPIMHRFELPEFLPADIPVEYSDNELPRDDEDSTDIPNKTPFSDVEPLDYYYQAVLWAVDGGITAGTSPTTFGSDAPCTRAQIVTFLYKDATN